MEVTFSFVITFVPYPFVVQDCETVEIKIVHCYMAYVRTTVATKSDIFSIVSQHPISDQLMSVTD
jgi:hypothetical protein